MTGGNFQKTKKRGIFSKADMEIRGLTKRKTHITRLIALH